MLSRLSTNQARKQERKRHSHGDDDHPEKAWDSGLVYCCSVWQWIWGFQGQGADSLQHALIWAHGLPASRDWFEPTQAHS